VQSVSLPSYGTKQLVIANSKFASWANSTGRPHGNSTWKKPTKIMRAKSKIVQSAHCEVCKINCDTKRVLDKHKLGKKHKKNLEKLNEATPCAQSSAESDNPAIGPQVPPDIGDTGEAVDLQNSRKKAAEPVEDLETKRRKVLQGGAAAEAVRTCAMCNVVCNSETVFNSHLAGQKHADMMKKHAAGTGMSAAS
jgi:aldehyde:ferredoxin oxidoreductase